MWGREAFGLPFHDNWWQTETGGIMIANYASHGHSSRFDGQPAARDRSRDRRSTTATGNVDVIDEPDEQGELALRPGWPSMFRGYWNEPERYQEVLSPAAGISPATWPSAMRMAISGSSAARTT